MRCLLMHKNKEVAVVEYTAGILTDVFEILCEKHMPIGSYLENMTLPMVRVYLQAWQRSRVIPDDRLNLQDVIEKKNIYLFGALSYGMALTDHYWIKGITEDLAWDDVNFYKNGFENSLLTLTGKGKVSKITPDYRTNGSLPKSWILQDDVPILLKDSPPWNLHTCANEVVAYEVAKRCNIPHAVYFPYRIGDRVYCGSPCFISSDKEEFIPFDLYTNTNHGPKWEMAKEFGLPEKFLHNMTVFDLLIGNADRHEGNFGILIDPDTMEYLRPAPLFDSGSCLMNTEVFKPFFATPDLALSKIKKCDFEIPSSEILERIVTEAYAKFGFRDCKKECGELIRNAEKLRCLRCM